MLELLSTLFVGGGCFLMGWGIHGIILTRRHIKDLKGIRRQLELLRRVS